jgi:hypothetical protein
MTVDKLAWAGDQFEEPKRSTVHLAEFAARVAGRPEDVRTAVDFGAGGGANMAYMARVFPNARWTGVDIDDELLDIGRQRLGPERFEFVQGDLLDLRPALGDRTFDAAFMVMTISWLDRYEEAMEQALDHVSGWFVLSGLFNPGDLDAFIRVRGRLEGSPHDGYDQPYNVYSLPRFERWCRDRGVTEFVAEPFHIDVDLDPPDHAGMASWTERMADGRRITFSGPLYMPWYFVALKVP